MNPADLSIPEAMRTAMQPFDLLNTATTLSEAPPLAALEGENAVWTPMRTIPLNVTGQPVLSLPIGFDGHLPLGMQIIGRKGDEDVICAAGCTVEQATDHSAQRPAL